LVAQLQSQVEELTKDKVELKRSNELMRTQLELLEQQNRTLLLNQLSGQSSQMNSGLLGHDVLVSQARSLNAPFGNLSRGGMGGGPDDLRSSAAMMLGPTGGGTMNDTLGSISFLDRLRLERHLQLQHQQQLLGLMGPTAGSSSQLPTDQDMLLNGLRKSNNSNFLG
jgi:hypothetical protein